MVLHVECRRRIVCGVVRGGIRGGYACGGICGGVPYCCDRHDGKVEKLFVLQ